MTDLIGKTLGKYQIVVRVGRGGMARVYKAYQSSLDRYVALKVLHSHLAEESDFVERFEREATAVARLRHPGIVQVYDYDIDDDLYYIVMEFVEGPTLKAEVSERRKRKPDEAHEIFTLEEVGRLLSALADAIDYAHQRGMIHRDLKPGNIMFTADGEVLLTDFGLARIAYASRHTQTGALSGTPAYMAPEQVQGGHVDARTDVYSLGVVAYELLTGQVPFTADTSYAIMTKHVTDDVPSMLALNPDLTTEVEAAVLKALSKDPSLRYLSAGEFAEALRVVIGLPSSVQTSGALFAPVATLADSQEMVPISTWAGPPTSSYSRITSPYRGLYAFREEDAPYFFGRESFTERLANTLSQRSMAAVVGPSGSGKSSVVFAGLLPQLREQAEVCLIEMRPGRQPFNSLAGALVSVLDPDISETARLIEVKRLAEALREKKLLLSEVIARIGQKSDNGRYQVLVVDQFEELYTLCTDEATRHSFPNALFEAIGTNNAQDVTRFGLVLTLRADFMGQALADRPFADALQVTDVKLGPMTRAELGRAIESPAAKKNVVFEAGLVDRILDDVGDEPGNLPLLEFALTLLWERRTGRRLTHAAYEAIGRVEGSLARYADEVYEQLPPPEQRLAKRVFTQMVRPGEGTEDTRRLATRSELGYEEWELAQKLADARLVVTGRTLDGEQTVEVVHEALIRGWGRLREWMNSERNFRAWQERLRAAMRQWEDSLRDEGALLRGVPLGEAEEWLETKSLDISAAEETYIKASVALRVQQAAEREAQRQRELEAARKLADEQLRRAEAEYQRAEEQARATRRMRALAVVLGVVFLLAVSAAILAVNRSQDASNQANARATEVVVRSAAQADAQANAELAATRAYESSKAQATAEAERERANQAAEVAIEARDEAEDERDRADSQAKLALSRQLAAQSATLIGPQLDLALLLSLEANNINDSAETVSGLLTALQGNPSLHTYLRGHPSLLQSVDFSPDGSRLVTAGSEGLVLIWDVEAGELLTQLEGHDPTQLVNRADFSPDGTRIATGSDDTSIILWDADSGEQLDVLDDHAAWVQSVEFSADGKKLISGSGDRTAIVWDVESGQPIQILAGHNGPLWDAALSQGGTLAATASNDGTTILWDLQTGQPIHTLTSDNAVFFSVDFSPDDKLLATGSGDNNVRLWDVETGETIGEPLTGHAAGVVSVAFSPDGRLLSSSSADSTVRIWDVETGQQLQLFGNHSGLVPLAEFSSDGEKLASGDATGVAILWDLSETSQPLGRVLDTLDTGVNKVSFEPTEGRLLAVAGADSAVRLWDVEESIQVGQTLTHALRMNEPVSALAYGSDGLLLATGSENGTAIVWDVTSGEAITAAISATPNGISSVAIGDDGQTLVTGANIGFSAVWDLASGQAIGVGLSGHAGRVNEVAISPNLEIVASGGEDGNVIIRPMDEIVAGQGPGTVLTYTGSTGSEITAMTFSPDGSILATGDDQGNLAIWDAPGGQLQEVAVSLVNGITNLDFNPTGTVLAVGDTGGNVRFWSTEDWSPSDIAFPRLDAGITALAFDSSGETIVALAADRTWVRWDATDRRVLEEGHWDAPGEAVSTIVNGQGRLAAGGQDGRVWIQNLNRENDDLIALEHSAPMLLPVSTVAYSPDGNILASSGNDGAIVLWDAQTLEPLGAPLVGHTAGVVSMVFSPDGQHIASGSCAAFHAAGSCIQGEVIVWNVASGEIEQVINQTVGFSQALAFSPDGDLLTVNDCVRVEVAGVCVEASVQLFDTASGESLKTLTGHSAFVWTADFSPDGSLLATGSADNTIILWDVEKGEPVGSTLTNHGGPVRRVRFSPDGKRLASAGFDNLVILWDVASGQAIGGPIATYTNNAMDAVFSPDGHLLASASLDGSVTLSDISPSSWRERACRIVNRNLRPEEWALFLGGLPQHETCP